MDIGEALFSKIWDFKNNLRINSKKNKNIEQYSMKMENIHSQFLIWTNYHCETKIKVLEAEGVGRIRGENLYIPKNFYLTNETEQNSQACLYRALFSSEMFIRGYSSSYDTGSVKDRVLIFLFVPKILSILSNKYPGWDKLEKEIHSILLEDKNLQPAKSNLKEWWDFILNRNINENSDFFEWADSPVTNIDNFLNYLDTDNWREKDIVDIPVWGLANKEVSNLKTIREKYQEATSSEEDSNKPLPQGTIKKAPSKEEVKKVNLSEKEDQLPVFHVLEKVRTAEKFMGGQKMIDGSDEMDDHHNALSELDLRELTRTSKAANSIYEAETQGVGAEVELEAPDDIPDYVRTYPEWNYKSRTYRENWCSLSVYTPKKASLEEYRDFEKAIDTKYKKTINSLKHKLYKHLVQKKVINRQKNGTDIDVDSLIQFRVDQLMGYSGEEKIYLDQKKRLKDTHFSVLLDLSMSTDSWVKNQRVLDVEKESVAVLLKVFDHLDLGLDIYGFNSHSRNNCSVYNIQSGKNKSLAKSLQRLISLRPDAYTRIGPAIRYATEESRKTKAKNKILIVISDSKPTDYDTYEGVYGIQDVRQSIREAKRESQTVVSLTIQPSAKKYLPELFGQGAFKIIHKPNDLAETLVDLILNNI